MSLLRWKIDVWLMITITPCVIIADRMTKSFFDGILDLGQSISVIKNVLYVTLVYNTGIAFGLFRNQRFVFVVVPIIAIILLIFNIYYYKKNGENLSRSYVVAFALILGGAFGNLYDRVAFGYVIDFIDFQVWPIFNIADSAITMGACIIAWQCFTLSKDVHSI